VSCSSAKPLSRKDHYDCIHPQGHDGEVIVWQSRLNKGAWRKVLNADDMCRFLRTENDVYMSIASFKGWRRIALLKELHTLYVDIDNPRLTMQQALETCDDMRIPKPNIAVESGGGVHLYWLIEPEQKGRLGLWQLVQNSLIKKLSDIGSDPVAKDCTRVLRLSGTKNTKRNATCMGYALHPHRYDLVELAFEVVDRDEKKATVTDISARRKTVHKNMTGSIYARWHLVYQDLLTIAEFHGSIPEGFRDQWCFLQAVALSWFTHPEGLEREIRYNMQQYTDLDDNKGMQAMVSVIDRAAKAARGELMDWQGRKVDYRYRFKRQTLFNSLGGLIPTGLENSLRAIVSDETAHVRKKARDAGRWSGEKLSRREKGTEMLRNGCSVEEVMKSTGAGRRTVFRWKQRV